MKKPWGIVLGWLVDNDRGHGEVLVVGEVTMRGG